VGPIRGASEPVHVLKHNGQGRDHSMTLWSGVGRFQDLKKRIMFNQHFWSLLWVNYDPSLEDYVIYCRRGNDIICHPKPQSYWLEALARVSTCHMPVPRPMGHWLSCNEYVFRFLMSIGKALWVPVWPMAIMWCNFHLREMRLWHVRI
jgi:hypothetical protein